MTIVLPSCAAFGRKKKHAGVGWGGYSGFQVTEWSNGGKKSKPQKIPRVSNKNQRKTLRPKINPKKSHAESLSLKNFQIRLSDTRRKKETEIELRGRDHAGHYLRGTTTDGLCSFVLVHQHGRRDVMWISSIALCHVVPAFTVWRSWSTILNPLKLSGDQNVIRITKEKWILTITVTMYVMWRDRVSTKIMHWKYVENNDKISSWCKGVKGLLPVAPIRSISRATDIMISSKQSLCFLRKI